MSYICFQYSTVKPISLTSSKSIKPLEIFSINKNRTFSGIIDTSYTYTKRLYTGRGNEHRRADRCVMRCLGVRLSPGGKINPTWRPRRAVQNDDLCSDDDSEIFRAQVDKNACTSTSSRGKFNL